MRRMTCITLVVLTLGALSGCLGGRPIRYYTVTFPPPTPAVATGAYPITLLIGHISAPEILEDQPIIYRSGQNEIGAYAYHQWVEPPPEMVKILLIRHLRASGKYQSIAQLGSSVQGSFLLHGRLYDFEEVDRGADITALVSMEFELYDRATHKEVWNRLYTRAEPVQGKKISDIVAALDHNLEQGLTEIMSGLDAYFSAALPRKP